MTIQEQIKKDLASAIKEKDEDKKSTIRIIMGEFGRESKKQLTDDDAVKVLKKLIKSEKETLEKKGEASDNAFISIIEAYLPKMASEDEIRRWIAQNIDFSEFGNKMQAMRPIMTHFGASADGNAVKKILQEM
jgi:uncharacterized protein YqeY